MPRRLEPIEIGTMVKAGDAAHLPPSISEDLVNVFHRPGPRIDKRSGWKSDVPAAAAPQTGEGYMLWWDKANNKYRLVITGIYVKHATDETWSTIISGAIGGMRDYANFGGKLFWFANSSGGVPQRYSYDGSVLDIDPFRERLSAESLITWKNRLWMFNMYQFIHNRLGAGQAYGNAWAMTGVTVNSVVTSGTTVTKWLPTSTTSAKAEIGAYLAPASSEDQHFAIRAAFRSEAVLYHMPMTLEIYVATSAARSTAYTAGTIRRSDTPNGFRYRARTTGTSGAGVPTWGLIVGGDTVDGTVTWVNEGPDALVSREIELDNATDHRGKFQIEYVSAQLPPMPASVDLSVRYKFGTTIHTEWELHPVDVGYQDGLPDGTLRKKNEGQQFTVGKFFYEFFNQESSDSGAQQFPNRIGWSEPGDSQDWRAENWYDMVEGDGGGIVIRPLDWALVAYKRNAINIYRLVEGVAAATLPIQYVKTFHGVGCIHPRAVALFEGVHYFIGEEEIYAFDGTAPPVAIAGEGMREAIFDKGADWVETQATANRPLLRVDEKNRELRIYSQKGKLWLYNLTTKKWSSETLIKDSSQGVSEIIDLIYFRQKFYAIGETNKIVREDSATTKDEVYSAGVTSYDVPADVWLHPFESLPRSDLLIESLILHHDIPGDQTGTTLQVALSFDRGVTFPEQHTITVPISSDRQPIEIPLWQSGPHLTVRLRHLGKAGPSYFNLFFVEAWVQDLGLELKDVSPATVSSSL